MHRRFAVIGGGITGLAAAHRMHELDPDADVVLLEARERLGGVLQTIQKEGCLMEAAADGFLTQPSAAVDLCRRLGLQDELIGTEPSGRRAYVVRRGRLQPIPDGFLVMAPTKLWPVLTTPILSVCGKLRMGLEYFLKARSDDADESLANFVCRRFGREVFERLVQPLLGGIYATDCEQLSLDATMPRFRQMEREHGSLIRAALRRKDNSSSQSTGGARYGQFMSLRHGMGSLIEALCRHLPEESIWTRAPVLSLASLPKNRWELEIGGNHSTRLKVDGVVIAAPARRAERLIQDVDQPLARVVGRIQHNSCAVVSLAYRREDIAHPLAGFGFVVPLSERRLILSGSFASIKYAGRAPDGTLLLRVFIGGGCHVGLLQLSDSDLWQLAHHESASLLGIRGMPTATHVARHTHAMPEYQVGHLQHVEELQRHLERHPTLALAGNSYQGVGVPHCIESGESAAERLLTQTSNMPERSRQVGLEATCT